MTVLVIVEHDRGLLGDAARQALTGARELAVAMDETVEAVVVGKGGDEVVAEVAQFRKVNGQLPGNGTGLHLVCRAFRRQANPVHPELLSPRFSG